MILFPAPDLERPSGGVRTIYRVVDLLNDAGVDAAVLHARAGFRCTWFANTTRVEHPPVTVSGHDVLVLPEECSPVDVARFAPGVPKVIFNQNAYRTFRSATRLGGRVALSSADHPDVAGVLAVSEDNRSLLVRALPNARVVRMHHWIDTSIFHPGPHARQHRIVVMPRKRPADLQLLADLLSARGVLDHWELRTMEQRPEREVAEELRCAALFVALGREEGFGLPVAEALASGCPVVGFHGMGGRELFGAEFAVAIEDGDVLSLAEHVEAFVAGYDDHRGRWDRVGADAAAFIASRYSREQATRDLLTCFSQIDPRPAASPFAVHRSDLPGRTFAARAREHVVRIGRRISPGAPR